MTAIATIFVTRLATTGWLPDGRMRQEHAVVNFPGVTSVVTLDENSGSADQVYRFGGEEFTSSDDAAAAWRAERVRRELRDRLGFALRRWTYGLARPQWDELPDYSKAVWRNAADDLARILASVNVGTVDTEERK